MSSICTLLGTTGLVAVTLLLGSACSPKSERGTGASALLVDAGDAKDKKDWKTALASLDLVIADPKATAEERSLAWQDKVVCEGRFHGDAAASAALQKLEDAKIDFEAKYYFQMGNELKDADLLHAALDVITVATEKFKGDKLRKKQLRKFARDLNIKLEAAGDTAGTEKLKGLGYLNSSDEDDE